MEILLDSNGYYDFVACGQGEFRSWRTKNGRRKVEEPRTLKQCKDSDGYLYVCICINNQRKNYYTHKCMALAHLGVCPEGKEVRHLDGNKLNNHINNLQYGTCKENQQDKIAHGTIARGSKSGNSKLDEETVYVIKKHLKEKTMTIKEMVKIFNISKSTLYYIKDEVIWKHIKV